MLLNIATEIQTTPTGALYNFLVSGSEDEWTRKPFQIELSRCVREHTTPNLTRLYGSLDVASIAELKRAPCIFAYETGNTSAPNG
jgi:hypothetical protein